jgi:hypothetical protein
MTENGNDDDELVTRATNGGGGGGDSTGDTAGTEAATPEGSGFADYMSATTGNDFPESMSKLAVALEPEQVMPSWIVSFLESRRDVAREARRRAAQYPDFHFKGLDGQIAMQINAFHALIRAQCEALAVRDWRLAATYPETMVPTLPVFGQPNRGLTEGAV